MVRTYNWNPSTQTHVNIGNSSSSKFNSDKYDIIDNKTSWSNVEKVSLDLLNGKLSNINNEKYITRNDSLFPTLKTTNTSSPLTIQENNNYFHPSVMSSYTNGDKNNDEVSWTLPQEIVEGRTFIVGMKAYYINGSVFYKPIPVQKSVSSLINDHSQNKQFVNENPANFLHNNVEKVNMNNYVENKFIYPSSNGEFHGKVIYEEDRKLPILEKQRLQEYENSRFIERGKMSFNDLSTKDRHKYELLQQIEENKRRKEMERYKEWEMEEKRRIRDEMYLEKQRQAMKEEENQAKQKIEMIQKKAETIAAKATEISKNNLNVKDKHLRNQKDNTERDNNRKNNDINSEDRLSLKSLTSHSVRSTSPSSKRLEWWEVKKTNQMNVRSTSPPIPVLRGKDKEKGSLDVSNTSTKFEHPHDNEYSNNFKNSKNYIERDGRQNSVSSNKSNNLSATAESLQKQLRLTKDANTN